MNCVFKASTVKAWISRGKVPHAVLSTSSLVEVSLRDTGLFSMVSESELRLQYSMIFVRFVNGLVDHAQKGAFPEAVSTVAESIGLPGWFVDLRHSATHDKLPSLLLLRNGCIQALQWLHDNYWIVQQNFIADITQDLGNILIKYKESCKASAKGKHTTADTTLSLQKLVHLLTVDTYPDVLLPLLIQPGYLVPLAKKKRAVIEVDGTIGNLPKPLESLWLKLIDTCEYTWPGFCQELLCTILNIIGVQHVLSEPMEHNQITQNQNQSETEYNSQAFLSSACKSKSYLITLVAWAKFIVAKYGSTASMDLVKISEVCFKLPTQFTLEVLHAIMAIDSNIEKKIVFVASFLASKFDLEQSISITADAPSSQTTKQVGNSSSSIEDSATWETKEQRLDADLTHLKQRIEKLDSSWEFKSLKMVVDSNPVVMDKENDQAGWAMVDKTSWKACPLGMLPGNVLPVLALGSEYDNVEFLITNGIVQIPIAAQCAKDMNEQQTRKIGIDSESVTVSAPVPTLLDQHNMEVDEEPLNSFSHDTARNFILTDPTTIVLL
ncbi:rRNA-processing protein las1, variant 2 [Batrachochytrium dendrobatidis]|nr:rRNA-processing protein las1, variant 2 [Batrachochytrium dendrobatidis]